MARLVFSSPEDVLSTVSREEDLRSWLDHPAQLLPAWIGAMSSSANGSSRTFCCWKGGDNRWQDNRRCCRFLRPGPALPRRPLSRALCLSALGGRDSGRFLFRVRGDVSGGQCWMSRRVEDEGNEFDSLNNFWGGLPVFFDLTRAANGERSWGLDPSVRNVPQTTWSERRSSIVDFVRYPSSLFLVIFSACTLLVLISFQRAVVVSDMNWMKLGCWRRMGGDVAAVVGWGGRRAAGGRARADWTRGTWAAMVLRERARPRSQAKGAGPQSWEHSYGCLRAAHPPWAPPSPSVSRRAAARERTAGHTPGTGHTHQTKPYTHGMVSARLPALATSSPPAAPSRCNPVCLQQPTTSDRVMGSLSMVQSPAKVTFRRRTNHRYTLVSSAWQTVTLQFGVAHGPAKVETRYLHPCVSVVSRAASGLGPAGVSTSPSPTEGNLRRGHRGSTAEFTSR